MQAQLIVGVIQQDDVFVAADPPEYVQLVMPSK
jgi:hypothetical protein